MKCVVYEAVQGKRRALVNSLNDNATHHQCPKPSLSSLSFV